MLQVYSFVSTELIIYISTHPDNKEAIEMLKKINVEKQKMEEYIENRFGALSGRGPVIDGYFVRKPVWEVR